MPVVEIDTPDDPRLDPFRLVGSSAPPDAQRFVVEGALLVERLITSRHSIESVFCAAQHADHWQTRLPNAAPLYVADAELLNQIAGFKFHRGVMACGLRADPLSLEQALAPAQSADPLLVAVGVDLADPENLGSLIRSAACFGASAVVLNRARPDPLSRRVVRVSMGASLWLPVIVREDAVLTVTELSSRWHCETVAAIVCPTAIPLPQLPTFRRAAVVLGSEGDGLPENVANMCGHHATIPIHPSCDSLNVSVAAGVFLHHFGNSSQIDSQQQAPPAS